MTMNQWSYGSVSIVTFPGDFVKVKKDVFLFDVFKIMVAAVMLDFVWKSLASGRQSYFSP